MYKHKITKIDGKNAIVSLADRHGKTHIDLLICTDDWSPVSGRRDKTFNLRQDAIDDIALRYNLDMTQ